MSDISFKLRAEALGKSLENLTPKIEAEVNQAVKELAYAAHNAMVAKIQQMKINDKSRADYLSGLKIDDLGNNEYLIHLDGDWANKLESGFGPYGMKQVLLASQKIVQVGPRTGQPWVRKSKKDNHKYAAVPFDHHPYRQGGGSGDMATDIKKLFGEDQAGNSQALTQIFKDIDGNPREGKVATVKKVPDGMSKNLQGMAKFQHVSKQSGQVSSIYMTWRMISETGKDWQHPGQKGYELFKEAEKFVASQMDTIINTLLK